MKIMSKLLAFLLCACMVFTLCACTEEPAGTENNETQPTQISTEAPTEAPTDDGKVTYTVKVTDESGFAVAGVVVQLCKDSCIPSFTGEDGTCQFRVVEDDYKVSVTQAPEGYAADATEYHFDAGSYELTIVLKAAG